MKIQSVFNNFFKFVAGIMLLGMPLQGKVEHQTRYDPRMENDETFPPGQARGGGLPSATVEVVDDLPLPVSPLPIPATHRMDESGSFQDRFPGLPGRGRPLPTPVDSRAGRPVPNHECKHKYGAERVEVVSDSWGKPYDGPSLYYNEFNNGTDAQQMFSQEVSREIQTTCSGAINLPAACAQAGITISTSLKQTYNVAVPPRTKLAMEVHALLHDRIVKVVFRCPKCLWEFNGMSYLMTAAAGIKESFTRLTDPKNQKRMRLIYGWAP